MLLKAWIALVGNLPSFRSSRTVSGMKHPRFLLEYRFEKIVNWTAKDSYSPFCFVFFCFKGCTRVKRIRQSVVEVHFRRGKENQASSESD